MNSTYAPPVIQSVGLACVPIDDMPPGTALARKPVAAAVVTLHMREDGHREVMVSCLSDAREFEFPLPVLVEDALIAGAPTIITAVDRDVLRLEAAARRFFVEPTLGLLAGGEGMIDPTAMFGAGHDEVALCRRLGIAAPRISDKDVATRWRRGAPRAAEGTALGTAISRLILWAHGASFLSGQPDAFFETLLPLRATLIDLEATRPFGRTGSFASYYREYRARRDAGDDAARWLTFEDGLSYV